MDKELLQKYVEGRVTEEEVETVVDWLDESEENVREYLALHKLNDIACMNEPETIPVEKKHIQKTPLKKVFYEFMKIAALLILFWGGNKIQEYYQLTHDAPPEVQTLYVPAGQRAELTLPDHTKVWLNAKSKLIYPIHFDKKERSVKLEGEAFFEVTPNKKAPFTVKTNKVDITVLGTAFNVVAYAETEETAIDLLSGKIELKAQGLTHNYLMKPTEHAIYKNEKLYLSSITDYDRFKWKEGIISFNNEPIELILNKLQLYYDVKIKTNNQPFLQDHYSGKFRTNDGVEQVLKVLQIEYKFTYTKDNDSNLIIIK